MRKSLLLALMLFGAVFSALAQIKVTGTVKDDVGESLPGATVTVKGTTSGTVTDIDGKYSLQVPNAEAILVFSFVGYESQEIAVGSQTTIDIVMQTATVLEEVVVVAYGEQDKRSITGAMGVVSKETISNQQLVSVGTALQGTTPGVNIISGTGQPGENPTIRIRGVGSINASASPLIVLDGVVYNGNLSSISSDEIESMTVLKDASSAALYGSRAANGVLLITTKSGTPGNTQVTLNSSFGVSQRAVNEYKYVNADDYMSLTWEALKFEGQDLGVANPGQYASEQLIPNLAYNPYGVDMPIDNNGNLVPGASLLWETDWDGLLNRDQAVRKDLDLSVSGGSDKLRYFFSTGYLNQEGLVLTSKFERINTRLNLDATVNDWLTMGVKSAVSYSDQNFPNQAGSAFANNIQYIRSMPSIYPLYRRDATGALVLDAAGNPIYDFGSAVVGQAVNSNRPPLNPSNLVATTELNDVRRERIITNLNGYLQADFLKDFTFRSTFGLDFYVFDRMDFDNPDNGDGENVGGRIQRQKNMTTAWTWYNKLSYSKKIGDHSINASVIAEAYNYSYEYLNAQKTGFPFNGLKEFNSAASLEALDGYTNQARLLSQMGQVNYGFKDRYFINLSARVDKSSRFDESVRAGTFTSIGGSWIVSDESFLANSSFINMLKLRASYGQLGNNDLQDNLGSSIYFPYISAFATGYDDLTNPGVFQTSVADPRISWETTTMMNVGVDFSILKGKLSGTVEWYNKKTEDLLFNQPVTPSTGVPSISTNLGALANRGIEVSLSSVNINKNDFSWRTDFNISFERNEILELPQEEIINGSKKWQVGKSIYDFFIQEWAGVNPETGQAQWYMDEVDADTGEPTGNKVITEDYDEATRYFQDSALPFARGGVTNTVNYKGLTFSFLLAYSLGGKVYDSDYAGLMHGLNNMGNQMSADILNRWQQPGDITDVPRLNTGNSDVSARSTRFLYDNTYARLRNVTLGYNFDKNFLSKTGFVKSLRVYIQADNMLTFSKRKGMDPEQAITGLTNNRSSMFKTVSGGITVGF